MRLERFKWKDAGQTAWEIRSWIAAAGPKDVYEQVAKMRDEIERERDTALLRLTAELDGVEMTPAMIRVDPREIREALRVLDPSLRDAMEIAISNIQAVAEAQVSDQTSAVDLPQGQIVRMREVPVASAGVYAPGGRAAYPSSVLMGAIPARVAGVEHIAVASPPDQEGRVSDTVLAAAALCGVDEVYAMGGAQAILALTYGTKAVTSVDVIVGPGNPWVQEAKRAMVGVVGIDSYAGPSELMLIADDLTDPEWAALDLCAQAEHGPESPLVVAAESDVVLDAISSATESAATARPSVCDAPLALVRVPGCAAAIDLANTFAPEHLELLTKDAASLAEEVRTAGCVFVGDFGATAFGDYVAGSNHVLPTTRSGRFSGPLGPHVFRRKISTVEVPPEAAAKLAPHADILARAEGFPVHGESAMIRAEP